MKVLVLNSGSSSIKFQLFAVATWRAIAAGAVSRIGEDEGEVSYRWTDPQGHSRTDETRLPIPNHRDGIERIVAGLQAGGVLADLSELAAIGHRVVHGGERFQRPTLVDDAVVEAIRDMIPLAPLHNPANLDGIEVARTLFPGVPSVAVFDTAFHQTMPSTAYRYAIPEYLYLKHRVRRYGFHGTSHQYVGERAAAVLGKPFDRCNLITLHLGNGASATAIRAGRSIDTSMGMTPLEGLVMGTRCGDLDPAILFYTAEQLGLDNQALDDLLNRQSGLLGLCGVNDMREIHRLAAEGDDRAELAIAITARRIRKYIGAYYAELGRVDAIVFTGGIGENDAEVRHRACAGLENLGIALDDSANLSADRGERAISAAHSQVKILVIPTNEELAIARQALAAVGGG
ncbi:acetate/propionate family kinase [uncultured Thiodictyon sp.]|uniref:acetate/propionate family kinase n=1 Tax=uncultured Thiodictyon sp. TaxID=1846217 RepID=UPI0025CCF8A0|nr:acetate kinase [uncultured Thiodictyon sp.]